MIIRTFPNGNPDFNSSIFALRLACEFNPRYHTFALHIKDEQQECIIKEFKRKINVSQQQRRDFAYFNADHLTKWYWMLENKRGDKLVLPHAKGFSALETFSLYDSQGIIVMTREPLRLTRCYTAKFTHGITIDNWIASCKEGTCSRKEVKIMCQDYPSWVYKEFLGRWFDL